MKKIMISELPPSLFERHREAGTGSHTRSTPVRIPRKLVPIRPSRVVTIPSLDWKMRAAGDDEAA